MYLCTYCTYFGNKKFDRENIDSQHLRPPVLVIQLETIERENFNGTPNLSIFFPIKNITLYSKLNMIHCYFHEKNFMVNIIFTSSIYNFLMTNVFQMQFFRFAKCKQVSHFESLCTYLLLCIENYYTENFANFHKLIMTIRECVTNVHE